MKRQPTADRPILSIIIVHFNTPDFLKQCLSSLQKSSLLEKQYEVFVVDNASLHDVRPWLKKDFPHVRLVQNTGNTGFSRANNQAIRLSRGRYVLLLNPDTVVKPETLQVMVAYMDGNPRAGAATCRLELADGTLDDACHRGFPTPWNALCFFSGLARLFPSSSFFNGYHLGYRNLDVIHEIDSACGAFLLIRRSAGEAIDWLDEEYFWYGEDIDLCYRLKQKNWKILFVPHVKTLHYKGVSSGIKKHSQDVSTANHTTRLLATKARFTVMRIFYKKHYFRKYPKWLTWCVFNGVSMIEWMILSRIGGK